jgi:hypothetical protein
MKAAVTMSPSMTMLCLGFATKSDGEGGGKGDDGEKNLLVQHH